MRTDSSEVHIYNKVLSHFCPIIQYLYEPHIKQIGQPAMKIKLCVSVFVQERENRDAHNRAYEDELRTLRQEIADLKRGKVRYDIVMLLNCTYNYCHTWPLYCLRIDGNWYDYCSKMRVLTTCTIAYVSR